RSTCAADTSADGTPCRWASRCCSSCPPRPEERLQRRQRAAELVALDGPRRIDVLGAGPRTFADEGTAPDALVIVQDVPAFLRPFIAGIKVVALGQGDRRRADELRV